MKSTSTPRNCYHQDRDLEIIEMLSEDWELLTVQQLVALKQFPAIRRTQIRMNQLYENGDVLRGYSGNKYYYYVNENPTSLVEHKIGVNWARIYLVNNRRSWECFNSFHYEQNYGFIRPDGLLGLKNVGRKTKENIAYTFIEMDLSNNTFDKVTKYNDWYDNNGYENVWWKDSAWGFPRIFIVTNTKRRKNQIEKLIEKENKPRLPKSITFEVMLYSDVIKECMKSVIL